MTSANPLDPIDDDYELKLITTPDLVAELGKRFQNLVFLGQVDVTTDGESEHASFIHGNFYTCLGMIASQYGEMCNGPEEV